MSIVTDSAPNAGSDLLIEARNLQQVAVGMIGLQQVVLLNFGELLLLSLAERYIDDITPLGLLQALPELP